MQHIRITVEETTYLLQIVLDTSFVNTAKKNCMKLQDNYIFIDIETYCEADLTEVGVYKYVEHPSFRVRLFGWCIGNSDVVIEETDNGLPGYVLDMLSNENFIFFAHNAQFEITCLSACPGVKLHVENWRCLMVYASYFGLPLALAKVCQELGHGHEKLTQGKQLITKYSMPQKKTGTMYPADADRTAWEQFKTYCVQDVAVERENFLAYPDLPPSETEHANYIMDLKINSLGVAVDMEFVEAADWLCTYSEQQELQKLHDVGIDNINSNTQVKKWLAERGYDVTTLRKEDYDGLTEQVKDDELALLVLQLKQNVSLASIKKYDAMKRCVCRDGRVKGMFQFYGAHTGRSAGRLVQLQNLPQNHIEELDLARELTLKRDYETLEMAFGNVKKTMSQLLRTSFIGAPEHVLIVSDFSSIEARITAWIADEKWRLDVFNTHGKIYEASAAMMYKVPIESIKKGSRERQQGKIAELAFGYQGGVGAGKRFGMDKLMPENEIERAVKLWRQASPNIVAMWNNFDSCCKAAVREKGKVFQSQFKGILFKCIRQGKNEWLVIKLPNGRYIFYFKPQISTNNYNQDVVTYMDMPTATATSMVRVETYGGKLTENIVQSIARDVLFDKLRFLHERKYKIVMHVHDEVVIEQEVCDNVTPKFWLDRVNEVMRLPLDWCPGLPLNADGFITKYYKKD